MEAHFNLSDDEFEKRFETCRLSPSLFTHEAHLRLAWIHIRKYGMEQAINNICRQLQSFVEAAGAADKFNKTLTVAAVRAVAHFISKAPIETFYNFIQYHPRLKYKFRDLMAVHYSIDIYHAQSAKADYLEPDLVPFS